MSGELKLPGEATLHTYRLADGEPIYGEYDFVTGLDGWFDDLDEPTDIIEEVWVLQSTRVSRLPKCSQCDEPASFWGLCTEHAKEDDPEYFANPQDPAVLAKE